MSTKETESLPEDAENTSDTTHRPSTPQPTLSDSTMSSPKSASKFLTDDIYPTKQGTASIPQRKNSENNLPNTAPDQNVTSFEISGPASNRFEREGFPKAGKQVQYMASLQSLGGSALRPEGSNMSSTSVCPELKCEYVKQIQDVQADHDQEYKKFKADLDQATIDRKQVLINYKWDEFESNYLRDADEAIRKEQDKAYSMAMRYKHMLVWMQTSGEKEAQRAIKRLRTRIAFVQSSEEDLARKQAHQTKVFNAFQSAMSLLHNS